MFCRKELSKIKFDGLEMSAMCAEMYVTLFDLIVKDLNQRYGLESPT